MQGAVCPGGPRRWCRQAGQADRRHVSPQASAARYFHNQGNWYGLRCLNKAHGPHERTGTLEPALLGASASTRRGYQHHQQTLDAVIPFVHRPRACNDRVQCHYQSRAAQQLRRRSRLINSGHQVAHSRPIRHTALRTASGDLFPTKDAKGLRFGVAPQPKAKPRSIPQILRDAGL